MHASAQSLGANWVRFVQTLTCTCLTSLGCGGSTFDGLEKAVGGSGNLKVGGSTGGVTGYSCFSPTQNLSSAYQSSAKGCACNGATDASVCVQGVGLICESNVWIAVADGPCMPAPGTGGAGNGGNTGAGGSATGGNATGGASIAACFSPTQNTSNVKPGASGGCACNPVSDAAVCVRGVGFICDSVWLAVYDGPCMPGTGGANNGGNSGVGGQSTGGKSTGGSATGGATGGKSCGGWAGDTCTASEYCAYQAGQLCGAADAQAVCQSRPQTCNDIYAPVCGCNGKSYANSCAAALAGTGVNTANVCTN